MGLNTLINIRRSLHQIPEIAGKEVKTREFIRSLVIHKTNNIQIDYDTEFGIIAKYHSNKGAPTLAFRAEMDGLPIEDKKKYSYRSLHKGMNHACGHDVHMAILLNLLLHVDQSKYNVNILFIFQSAEEVYAGARRLIQPLEYYSIDYLFALHVAPNLYAGYFSLSSEVMLAANYSLELNLKLTSGHVAVKMDVVSLFASIHHFQESYNNTNRSIKLTKIETNGYYNINPNQAKILVNLRGEDQETNYNGLDEFLKHIREHDSVVSIKFDVVSDYPSLKNDNQLNQLSVKVFEKKFGADSILQCPFILSSDDFAFYGKELKGVKCCYYFIGSYVNQDIMVHTENFDVDENSLFYGFESFKTIVNVFSKFASSEIEN